MGADVGGNLKFGVNDAEACLEYNGITGVCEADTAPENPRL